MNIDAKEPEKAKPSPTPRAKPPRVEEALGALGQHNRSNASPTPKPNEVTNVKGSQSNTGARTAASPTHKVK